MKIVNIVLALGTAIILGALVVLGIAAFYPAPTSPTYPNVPIMPAVTPCASSDAKCLQQNQQIEAQQTAQQQAQQDQFNQEETAYENQVGIYDRNIFIIANIIGIIIFIIGFLLVLYAALADQGVPIGIMLAGLWSIMYGYGRGWGSIDDQLKFFVGLVVAVIVIGGSMWLMQRRARMSA
jgi:heme/copper-type cytochrome/quinol oxidase subunit 4